MMPPSKPINQSLDERSAELLAFGQKLRLEFADLRHTSRLLRNESTQLREGSRRLRKNGATIRDLFHLFADFSLEEG